MAGQQRARLAPACLLAKKAREFDIPAQVKRRFVVRCRIVSALLLVWLMHAGYLAMCLAGFGFLWLAALHWSMVWLLCGTAYQLSVLWLQGGNDPISTARKKLPRPSITLNAPGTVVGEGEAPELYAMLRRVTGRTGVRTSIAACVDWSANAGSVAYRRSYPRRSRRFFRIGLPLLTVLSRKQLEILLTYDAAMVSLSLKLVSMVRAWRDLSRLAIESAPPGEREARLLWLRVMLRVCDSSVNAAEEYARTLASEERQEVNEALARAKIAEFVFRVFRATDLSMVTQTGHLAPVAEGFARFWRTQVEAGNSNDSEPRASVLLRNPAGVDARLAHDLVRHCPAFERISWEQFGGKILGASWEAQVKPYATKLVGLTAGQICHFLASDGVTLGRQLFQPPGRLYDPHSLKVWTARLLGTALALALSRAGWELSWTGPGAPIVFVKEKLSFKPFEPMETIFRRKLLDADRWIATCREAGIADLKLVGEPETGTY
jgi:hypothetical protein